MYVFARKREEKEVGLEGALFWPFTRASDSYALHAGNSDLGFWLFQFRACAFWWLVILYYRMAVALKKITLRTSVNH